MGSPRDRLDEQARRELDDEAERHRQTLAAVTPRDLDGVVAEANRHFSRIQEIMRAFAKRVSGAVQVLAVALCVT